MFLVIRPASVYISYLVGHLQETFSTELGLKFGGDTCAGANTECGLLCDSCFIMDSSVENRA